MTRPNTAATSVAAADGGGRTLFVGRGQEMAVLRTALDDVLAGRGRLMLLAGEPGIGKTRLADEFGAEAAQRGTRVLWGRCWEGGGAAALWPWLQVIRAYALDRDEAVLRREMGAGAAAIAHLVPEVRARCPDLPEPVFSSDADEARFRLFDSVTALLQSAPNTVSSGRSIRTGGEPVKCAPRDPPERRLAVGQ